MSYSFITWFNAYLFDMDERKKKEGERKEGKKVVEGRNIFFKMLRFPWSSILWVKDKGGVPAWVFQVC